MFPHDDEPGSGPFVHEQVQALRRTVGLDVRVVSCRPMPLSFRRPWTIFQSWQTYRRGIRSLAWQDRDGVPVLYLPYLAGRTCQRLLVAPYRDAVLKAAAWIWPDFPFDLVHAHTAYKDGFAGLALARKYGTPLVITEHTGPFSCLTKQARTRQQTLTALGCADRVWCVSHSLAEEVRSYFPSSRSSHIRTLPNGVDPSLFHPPSIWHPDPLRPKLLFVGFLLDCKHPLLLIEAFARLRPSIPGALLNMVGHGPLKDAIHRKISALDLTKFVRLYGHVSRREVAALMRDECDVLVLPSRHETFGVVLIEALASGKPVVATRCGGPESIVTEPFLGELCPPNDEQALADCLAATVARLPDFDPVRIRNHAMQKFAYDVLASGLASQYQEILQNDG